MIRSPLRSSGNLKRKTPLSKTPLRVTTGTGEGPNVTLRGTKPQRAHQIPKRVRDAVLDRAEGQCEACGRTAPVLVLHHRLMRSQGGKDTVANLIAVSPACHARIHQNPARSYGLQLLLFSYENPEIRAPMRWVA